MGCKGRFQLSCDSQTTIVINVSDFRTFHSISALINISLLKGPFRLCVFMHNLRLKQHPIDAMLQFHAKANAYANVDVCVNGP